MHTKGNRYKAFYQSENRVLNDFQFILRTLENLVTWFHFQETLENVNILQTT